MSINNTCKPTGHDYKRTYNQHETSHTTRIAENFFKAARCGNIENVTSYLKTKSVEVNAQDKAGYTALHYAAKGGHKELVIRLLEYKANPCIKNTKGQLPLHLAAMHGHNICVKRLLECALDTRNWADNSGYTPFHCVAFGVPDTDTYSNNRGSSTRIIETLSKYGADVNAKSQLGATPLHIAALQGHRNLIEVLLKNPLINPNTPDIYGGTPLHVAVENRYFDTIAILIKKGVNVNLENNGGETPLFTAVRTKNMQLVKEILSHRDTQVNRANKKRCTPLHLAIKERLADTAIMLLEHGAKVNAQDLSGNTPLHLAVQQNYWDGAGILCTEQLDVNAKNNDGDSPLHMAVSVGCAMLVRLLTSQPGIFVNIQNSHGESPLFMAINKYIKAKRSQECTKYLYEIIKVLLKEGASPNLCSQNIAPEQLINEYNLTEINELIKELNAEKDSGRRASGFRSRKRRRT